MKHLVLAGLLFAASGASAVSDPLPADQVFAFPNPARSQTTIRFMSELPGSEVRVRVFDVSGGLVKEWAGPALTSPKPGLTHAAWDLTNDLGQRVASGVYLFEVKVSGPDGVVSKVIKKLAVVR